MSLHRVPKRMAARFGYAITYRDVDVSDAANPWEPPSKATTDYSLQAGVRHYRPKEVTGLVQLGDRLVTIAADDLAVTPKEGDQIKIGTTWYRVYAVDPRGMGDTVSVYRCSVRA